MSKEVIKIKEAEKCNMSNDINDKFKKNKTKSMKIASNNCGLYSKFNIYILSHQYPHQFA